MKKSNKEVVHVDTHETLHMHEITMVINYKKGLIVLPSLTKLYGESMNLLSTCGLCNIIIYRHVKECSTGYTIYYM